MQARLTRIAGAALVTLGAAGLFAATTHKPKAAARKSATTAAAISIPAGPTTVADITMTSATKVLSGGPSMNIVDGDPLSTDSVLVRAAKRANLSRAQYAKQGFAPVVLDETMLAGATKGTVFEGSGPTGSQQEYAQRLADATAEPGASPAPGPSATQAAAEAARKQKAQALKQEYQRMAEQSDEVYPNDASEDQVDRRLHDIPNEIKNLETVPVVPVNPPPQ